jgi:hypothetical protein
LYTLNGDSASAGGGGDGGGGGTAATVGSLLEGPSLGFGLGFGAVDARFGGDDGAGLLGVDIRSGTLGAYVRSHPIGDGENTGFVRPESEFFPSWFRPRIVPVDMLLISIQKKKGPVYSEMVIKSTMLLSLSQLRYSDSPRDGANAPRDLVEPFASRVYS